MQAVDGNTMSGVDVATMIRSTSSACGRRIQRGTCRGQRQVAGVDAVVGEVARADAGALDDPGVAGLDAARRQHRVAMSSLVRRRGGR
jgi:hypothetical protein